MLRTPPGSAQGKARPSGLIIPGGAWGKRAGGFSLANSEFNPPNYDFGIELSNDGLKAPPEATGIMQENATRKDIKDARDLKDKDLVLYVFSTRQF